MTLVVFRDGVMAADSAHWAEDILAHTTPNKIKRIGPWLVASAGNSCDCEEFATWFEAGATIAEPPKMMAPNEFVGVAVRGDRQYQYQFKDEAMFRTDITDTAEGWAIGIGEGFVMGLLACGKSAVECVEIAKTRLAYIAGEVQVEHVDGQPELPNGMMIDLAEPPKPENWKDAYGIAETP